MRAHIHTQVFVSQQVHQQKEHYQREHILSTLIALSNYTEIHFLHSLAAIKH